MAEWELRQLCILVCVCVSQQSLDVQSHSLSWTSYTFQEISYSTHTHTHYTHTQNLSALQNHTLLPWHSFKPSAKGQGSNEKKAVYRADRHTFCRPADLEGHTYKQEFTR